MSLKIPKLPAAAAAAAEDRGGKKLCSSAPAPPATAARKAIAPSPTSVATVPTAKAAIVKCSWPSNTRISPTNERISDPPLDGSMSNSKYRVELAATAMAVPIVFSPNDLSFAPRSTVMGNGRKLPPSWCAEEPSLGRRRVVPGPNKPVASSNTTTNYSDPVAFLHKIETVVHGPAAGSDRSDQFFRPLSKKRKLANRPAGTALPSVGNFCMASPGNASAIIKPATVAAVRMSASGRAACFPSRNPIPSHCARPPKNEYRQEIAGRFARPEIEIAGRFTSTPKIITPTTLTSFAPTPSARAVSGCKLPSYRPSLPIRRALGPPNRGVTPTARRTTMLYVAISMKRPETSNSWGLAFTKDPRGHALIVRVVPRSDANGPTVKWCRIADAAPRPSAVYRTNFAAVAKPAEDASYESSLLRGFPPPPREEKGLRDAGLLAPCVHPGDAIVAINGIAASAFPTMRHLASYIRRECQRKMTVVAMRHEDVWRATLESMLAGRSRDRELGDSRHNNERTKDHTAKVVKEAWNSVMFSRNGYCRAEWKAHPAAKKRPKVFEAMYTNSLMRDEGGKPIPYCDNNDFDPEDGKRIRDFVNGEIENSFNQWLKKRKAAWGERLPKKHVRYAAEDATTEEVEGPTVQHEFWLANGHGSFDRWLSASKSKWTRSYSWHVERRETLQSECEKEVHFPQAVPTTPTVESGQAVLDQFGSWLNSRKQQWRLERRKRQRGHRVEPIHGSATLIELENVRSTATGEGCDPRGAANSNNRTMYLDEILEDEEERLLADKGGRESLPSSRPMDISWVFDSEQGAPDDVVVNVMTYLLPSDHGNLLCLSFGSNFLFKQRQDVWKALCPTRWVLPRRPRKSWCVMYVTRIRAEEEASRKRSDDLLVKANAIMEKGDQLNKLEKLVRKAEKDFEFSVNYTSGVVLERNSIANVAVTARRHKIVKWLIEEKGADVESCDRGRFTPLMNAAWNGDKHIVRYLLGKGCDRTKVGYNHCSRGLAPASFRGLCAEGWARKRGHDEVADLIRDGL